MNEQEQRFIHEQAEQILRRKRWRHYSMLFGFTFTLALVITFAVWLHASHDPYYSSGEFERLFLLTAGWGMTLFLLLANMLLEHRNLASNRQQVIEQLTGKWVLDHTTQDEKQKHSEARLSMTIDAEGELVPQDEQRRAAR